MKQLSESNQWADHLSCWVSAAVGLLLVVCVSSLRAELPPVPETLAGMLPQEDEVLARVDGRPVTGKEVRVRMLTAPQQEQEHPRELRAYIQEAVDRKIIEQFLKRRKLNPASELVEDRMRVFQQRAGDAAALERMGLDEELLRRQVTLSLAWLQHAQSTLTDSQFREYFQQHRAELDGTRLHLEQVFRPIAVGATAAERSAAERELTLLRSALIAGDTVFEEAAGQEGDLGWQTGMGNAPREVLQAAFRLQGNEISEVISSAHGLHLVRVVERIPGQLSLEDVRTEVLSVLSGQLWDEELERQRKSARIEILAP